MFSDSDFHCIAYTGSLTVTACQKKKKTLAGSETETQFPPKYGQELRGEGSKLGACVWGGAMMRYDGQFWNALGSGLKIL